MTCVHYSSSDQIKGLQDLRRSVLHRWRCVQVQPHRPLGDPQQHIPLQQARAAAQPAQEELRFISPDAFALSARAQQAGGAVYEQDTLPTATVANTTFSGNSAATGSGVAIRNGNTKLRENLGLPDSSIAVISLAGSQGSQDASTGALSGHYDSLGL